MIPVINCPFFVLDIVSRVCEICFFLVAAETIPVPTSTAVSSSSCSPSPLQRRDISYRKIRHLSKYQNTELFWLCIIYYRNTSIKLSNFRYIIYYRNIKISNFRYIIYFRDIKISKFNFDTSHIIEASKYRTFDLSRYISIGVMLLL